MIPLRARDKALVIAGLLAGFPRVELAQTILVGTVTSEGRVVAYAEVSVAPGGLLTKTDDRGRFSLVLHDLGLISVFVRAVGYYPQTRKFLLSGEDTVSVAFQLERAPQQLESLTVEAKRTTVVGKMQAFEEHRAAGFGSFFTRDMLAGMEHLPLSDVLRRTTGLRFVKRPTVCGGGLALTSGRGGAVTWQPWMICYTWPAPFPTECYLAIYVDGTRVWTPGSKEPPDINQFSVSLLEGIEIYRGPGETPIQYQITGSACGVALLWTRTGDR